MTAKDFLNSFSRDVEASVKCARELNAMEEEIDVKLKEAIMKCVNCGTKLSDEEAREGDTCDCCYEQLQKEKSEELENPTTNKGE